MNKIKLITTAIDYPNGKPHIGHLYEKIIADFYKRYYNLSNQESYLLTGTDENGQKLALSAKGYNTKEYLDKNVINFLKLCKNFNINYDKFIRTTDQEHVKEVKNFWHKLKENNYIYKGDFNGKYCYGCESFFPERILNCPDHKKELSYKKEIGYFFKLSYFKEDILNILENEDIIQPAQYKDQLIQRIKQEGLSDLLITRLDRYNWGIQVPEESNLVFYTWFDALFNYYSGAKKHWSPDLQIIGKDIIWFHGVIWLGLLLALKLKTPKRIYVHGIIRDKKGKKFSKTLKNGVELDLLKEKYPVDLIRYYLLRNLSSQKDNNFSEEDIKLLYKVRFIQGIGNLYSRLSNLRKDYTVEDRLLDKNILFNEEKINNNLAIFIDKNQHDKYILYLEKLENSINKYISDLKPWSLNLSKKRKVVETATYNFLILIKYYEPIIPGISHQININIKNKIFDGHLFGNL